MPLFIPFLIGAGTTGYFWYNNKKKKEDPTFQQDLFKILAPVLGLVLVVLILRWFYNKGSNNKPKPIGFKNTKTS